MTPYGRGWNYGAHIYRMGGKKSIRFFWDADDIRPEAFLKYCELKGYAGLETDEGFEKLYDTICRYFKIFDESDPRRLDARDARCVLTNDACGVNSPSYLFTYGVYGIRDGWKIAKHRDVDWSRYPYHFRNLRTPALPSMAEMLKAVNAAMPESERMNDEYIDANC